MVFFFSDAIYRRTGTNKCIYYSNYSTSYLFRNTNRLYIITINDTPEKCFVCCVLTELLQNNIINVIMLKTCYRGKIMIKHQRKIFGIKFDVERINPVGLPLYLTAGRSFWRYTYSGMSFIIVNIPNDEKFGVIAFEKQRALLEKRFESPVAFSFSYISGRQRDSLIEKNIPFISDAKQLYLPFLGVMLSDRLAQQKQINAEKMMPVTQALFLHILYNSNNKPMLKKDAAEFLCVTRTSITRASDQLLSMDLISQDMIGKECYMMPVMTGKELYKKAKPFLINPVQRVITTDSDFDCYPFSGESALSMCSMLNAPKIPVRAIYKSDVDINEISEIDVRWSSDDSAVNLELWKYDPRLFEKKGVVDPVSLAMSLKENVDERIETSIEEYLEEYEW